MRSQTDGCFRDILVWFDAKSCGEWKCEMCIHHITD